MRNVCQGCVNQGLITQKALDACDDFARRWPRAAYGPAHIVIDDNNVDDGSLNWCLDNWDKYAGDEKERVERTAEYEATKAFLRELLTWPESERCGEVTNGD